jgi:hypothetical protein
MQKKIGIAVLAALLAAPVVARAQGIVGGAERGANAGDRAAGPVGGIVGGAVGAGIGAVNGAVGVATGTVDGVLGINERPRFHDYVVREHVESYPYDRDLRVGAILPNEGIRYYAVPPEYRVRPGYRYTVLNDHPVLVDPVTRRVVEVLD